jgi:hypothetical protein
MEQRSSEEHIIVPLAIKNYLPFVVIFFLKIESLEVSKLNHWIMTFCAGTRKVEKEGSPLYLNFKVRYPIDKNLPLVHNLIHINPVHIFGSCFCKVHSNISHTSTLKSSTWSLPQIKIFVQF